MRLPRDTANYALLFSLLAVLGLFLVYPIVLTVGGAVTVSDGQGGSRFTLEHLRLVFQDPTLRRGVLNATKLAVCTTLLAILIALPLAVCAARYKYPLKRVFGALVLVPLILPPFVGAIGVQMILGREGALNALLGTHLDVLGTASFWGIVVVQALSLYPIIFLNASAALANLDPALDEAAQNLGAGPWRRFFRVTLPLIRPGLFAGATIVFIWSFTELGTPLVFDYRDVTSVQIFNGLKEVETNAQPYALTLVLLVAAILSYVLGKLVFGGKAYAMYAKASRASAERPLGVGGGMVVTAAFALVTALALLPHVGVVLTAFSETGAWYRSVIPTRFTTHNFETALSDREAFGSIVNSLKLASAAMVVDLVLGLLVGYLIVRTRVWGRGLLDALSMLPLAVPGLVMAFGYVALTLRWPFGRGDPLEGVVSVVGATPSPLLLLVIAYAVRRLPYMVRATVAGLEQTSGELEEAAMNLGASRVYAVRKVIVPLIAANLIAGCLLAFSFAMLEVSDSLLLAQQQQHFPITKAILSMLNRLGDGPHIASAMGVWGMALLTVTLVGASVLIGKKMGSIFRV
jgi:iron(III) transport system permease protein